MNIGENRKRCGRLLKVFDEVGLVLGLLVECLQDKKLRRVIVPVQLVDVAVLMTVDAANAVHTRLGKVEAPTVLALELFKVDFYCSLGKLLLSVGEAALSFVPTKACLNPVLAHLGLELAVIVALERDNFVSFWLLEDLRLRGCAGIACRGRVELLRHVERLGGHGHFSGLEARRGNLMTLIILSPRVVYDTLLRHKEGVSWPLTIACGWGLLHWSEAGVRIKHDVLHLWAARGDKDH